MSARKRDEMGHNQFSAQPHAAEEEPHGRWSWDGSASHNKHASMAETIADCKALLCGGMGMGADESMRRLNIQPVVTELLDIDAADSGVYRWELIDHTELLH